MNNILKTLLRYIKLPGEQKISYIISQFSFVEKLFFAAFSILLFISAITMALRVNEYFKVAIPAHSGSLSEGIVGSPRFINPILAISDVDKDLSSIIYSGLMKYSVTGEIVADLAESYTVSTDGLTYTFKIKPSAVFHNGTPVTADDVIFTVQKALDTMIKSPKRANWEGVDVEKVDTRTVKFTLKKPYAPFIESTTIGILPKDIWSNVNPESFPFSNYNIEPIGSGPYKISSVTRDSGGLLTSYTLSAFDKYINGEPYISELVLKFYQNEDLMTTDFSKGNIDNMAGLNPENAKKFSDASKDTTDFKTAPLARSYGLFFNQNQSSVLRNPEVRTAIAFAINRNEIISNVLERYGAELYGPIPHISKSVVGIDTVTEDMKKQDKEKAANVLKTAGWTFDENGMLEKKTVIKSKVDKNIKNTDIQKLEFSISTSNSPDLKRAAETIQSELKAIGMNVSVKIFELGDLNQTVIRPRKYDALLFGQVINQDLDIYSFWHSSQRLDPGLNIAMYTNSDSDKILESMRTTTDMTERIKKLEQWSDILKKDLPAIFLFSPKYIYALSNRVNGANIDYISKPSDRWNGIEKWYVATDKVWKALAN